MFNLNNLFSENTKICFLLRDEIIKVFKEKKDIDEEKFEKYLKEFEEIAQDSYKTNDEDIEDLGDILKLCNEVMFCLITDKTSLEKYYDIVLTRKGIKKLINKKFREAHDFLYSAEISEGKEDKKTKPDEIPREIWNCHECEYQYAAISRYIWQPTTNKLKQITDSVINKEHVFSELVDNKRIKEIT